MTVTVVHHKLTLKEMEIMTKFQFTSDLLNIITALLQGGITDCSVHETRGYLNELFDSFEKHEGMKINEPIDRGDLEFYGYVIDCLHQEGYDLWLEEIQSQNMLPSEAEFIRELYKITGIPFGDLDCINLKNAEPTT